MGSGRKGGGKSQNSKQDPKDKKPNNKKKSAKQPKEKCFQCYVSMHQKHNCPKYLAKQAEKKHQNSKFDLHVLEDLLVDVNSSSWIIDSTTFVLFSSFLNHLKNLLKGSCQCALAMGRQIQSRPQEKPIFSLEQDIQIQKIFILFQILEKI